MSLSPLQYIRVGAALVVGAALDIVGTATEMPLARLLTGIKDPYEAAKKGGFTVIDVGPPEITLLIVFFILAAAFAVVGGYIAACISRRAPIIVAVVGVVPISAMYLYPSPGEFAVPSIAIYRALPVFLLAAAGGWLYRRLPPDSWRKRV